MSRSTILTAREGEIVRILRILGTESNRFVLVGGYAVNALAPHRFSVDCDLVINQETVPAIVQILKREGYAREPGVSKKSRSRVENYTKSLEQGKADVDLYVDRLTSRQTDGAWGYEFMQKNSIEAIVAGVTGSAQSRVASRELLTALKLHAGRDQDMADIVVLSERIDWESVAAFAACGSRKKVESQLASELQLLDEKKFISDLKSQFGLRADITPLIRGTSEGLKKVQSMLSNQSFRETL